MQDNCLTLCWQNLSLYVTVKEKSWLRTRRAHRIKLLHNVNGILKSGTLSAIMGPSGAGKTTLLSAIGQRCTGTLRGDITLNGRPVDKDLMVKMAGFVPQHDLALGTLTVREHMIFMASLRMDRRVSQVQQRRIITTLILELGLSACSNTKMSHLSGGEKKRVSLAVQLLTDPPLLICDEPTTGLDSYTATTVISLLRQLCSRGKAIICTVHQPTSGVFEMFDTVTLLAPGGRLAYFGEVNYAKKYFEELGLECPPNYNSAEFIVSKLNTHPDHLTDKFLSSPLFVNLHKDIEDVKKSINNYQLIFGMEEKFLKFYSVQPPSKNAQLKWLMWRSVLDMFRNSQKILLRFLMYIFTAFLISTPYIGVQVDQEGIQNLQGLYYSVVTETVFTQSYAVLHTFPAEIPILLREMGNGVYQPAPYYFSKVLVLLPRVVLETLFFCLVVHLVAGKGERDFFLFAFPVVASALASTAYGCCVSAMFENVSTASLLSVPFDFVSYCYSGIFLQLSSVPVYLAWLKYISRFYYALEAISIMQWSNVKNIPCSANPDIPCISDGRGVLYKYGYHPNNLFLDLAGLTIMFFLLNLVGFYFLRRRSRKQAVY